MQMLPDIEKLKTLVKAAAREELLNDFGHSAFKYKEDGSVVTPADFAMQNRLEEELKKLWPMYDFLGEEMQEAEQLSVIDHSALDENAGITGYWCIDPLDGTSNYAAGLPYFAVSVALIIDNQQRLALIYDPVRDEMFTAIKDQGAYLNDQLIRNQHMSLAENKPIIAEIDLKRLPEQLAIRLMKEKIYASQRNFGSSAIDWCWMSAGRFDIYLHGGQKMWDYAAGSLIFKESGGLSTSLDNEDVFTGKFEDRSVLACNDRNLFDYWRHWLNIPV